MEFDLPCNPNVVLRHAKNRTAGGKRWVTGAKAVIHGTNSRVGLMIETRTRIHPFTVIVEVFSFVCAIVHVT